MNDVDPFKTDATLRELSADETGVAMSEYLRTRFPEGIPMSSNDEHVAEAKSIIPAAAAAVLKAHINVDELTGTIETAQRQLALARTALEEADRHLVECVSAERSEHERVLVTFGSMVVQCDHGEVTVVFALDGNVSV